MRLTHLLSATALATATFALPQMAIAQVSSAPATQEGETAEEQAAESADTAGEITVVGSRIRRNQFSGADPIQLITRDEATAAGFNSSAEILQSNAVTGGTDQINDAYGGFVVAGGAGVNTVSLRGLGVARTLTLLNGRRISPGGTRGNLLGTDLNVLPSAMVERIEVLNTGASSIYGSDAVAGVINIVTRDNLRGIIGEAQHNFTEEGGGESRRYSLSGGFESNGFKVIGSVEYFKRDALLTGDRDWASCPRGLYGVNGDYGAADFVDPRTGQVKCFPLENGGVTINTLGLVSRPGNTVATAPGVPSGYAGVCDRFRPRAGAGGAYPGYECVGGGTLSTNIRDTSSAATLAEEILSGAEIYTGYGQVSYESNVLGNAEFYANVLASRRNSEQNGQRQFTLDYTFGSPLIPVELRSATPFLAAGAAGAGRPAVGARVFGDYGIYNNRQVVDFVRVNAGVRGDLFAGWRYDAFFGKSYNDGEYTTDLILTDRLYQSLDVVQNANGTFSCRNTLGGCVAAPALTPAIVGGQFREVAPAWFDYVTDPVTGTTQFRETTYNLTLDGPLFRLPGGMIQAAVGVEYRKQEINDQPAPDSVRNNLYGFTSSTPTVGEDSVLEAFAEVELPIITNSFLHNFTINASGRYTDYDSYGSQWTYKVGGILSPVRGLSFRGSYGTSYRAPALSEQFLGGTSGFLAGGTDPCNNLQTTSNPLVIERCQSEGIPFGFTQNSGVTVIGVGGAEAGLEAETSDALTFGVVLEPRFGESFGNLSFAVDYFRVKIDNGVAQLSAATVLSQCYANPQRTTCDTGLITRTPYTGPGSATLTVIQSYVNISDAKAEGIDYVLRYSRDLGPGTFRLGASLTQYLERYSRTLPTQDILDVVGLIENPEWTGTFDVNYGWDGWNFRYGVEWVDATDAQDYALSVSPAFTRERYDFRTRDYFLHSASLRYEMENYSFTLGVRNLFNEEPPKISADYTNLIGNAPLYSGYDLRGRTIFVGVRAGF